MAGDWIKIEHWTPDKPEVFQMAEALGIDPDAVTGKLVRVWIWADQQTIDGNAVSVTELLLDRITSVSGFAKALIRVGWLAVSDAGLQFVNFDRHNGDTAKQRALTAKRVKSHRNKLKRECNGDGVTSSLPEKRREEKNKNKNPLPPKAKKPKPTFDASKVAIPDGLASPEFDSVWSLWVMHRKEIRKPLTESQSEAQIAKLSVMGRSRAIAALNHSIAGGWQGIFEPDDGPTTPSTPPAKYNPLGIGQRIIG